jgi:ParB/RepB/Spo0J family partition protein
MAKDSRFDTTPEETQRRNMGAIVRRGKTAIEGRFNALERLRVEYVDINKLVPNDWNPNRQSKHDFELLMSSIVDDGFTQPIIVLAKPVKGKLVIVDGEHRWRAARELQFVEIPVVKVDMPLEQAKIATVRHNRGRGTHDIDLEAAILRDLQQLGSLEIALDSLMIGDAELERMLNTTSVADALLGADEYSIAWVPDKITKTVIDNGSTTKMYSGKTAAAQAWIDNKDELLRAAGSEEEVREIRRQNEAISYSLIFYKDEIPVVRLGLGDNPAQTVLRWSIEHAEKSKAEK